TRVGYAFRRFPSDHPWTVERGGRLTQLTSSIRTTGNLRMGAMRQLPVVPICRRMLVLIFRNNLDADPKSEA
ncbi:hypothetical protein, partial [Bradyrhizobium sp.]|uniref:hypothetical protein n=1 Tax=Bradyrhizobium sp. TaxID=376 RepID=UPI0025C2240D